eukprot:6181448-Pleurochrysis_carterae.AAC.2
MKLVGHALHTTQQLHARAERHQFEVSLNTGRQALEARSDYVLGSLTRSTERVECSNYEVAYEVCVNGQMRSMQCAASTGMIAWVYKCPAVYARAQCLRAPHACACAVIEFVSQYACECAHT